ncbi:hypothetical protein ACFQZ2_12500, partial [Streptomonospora algeriensis]
MPETAAPFAGAACVRQRADFPRPVSGSSTDPQFLLLDEVEGWCRDHGKAFEADGAGAGLAEPDTGWPAWA